MNKINGKQRGIKLCAAVLLGVLTAPVLGATLAPEAAETAQFMREEEKLARDVYQALHERWQLDVHARIASSEQRHLESMAQLLTIYNIEDPLASTNISERGQFVNAELQQLYDRLNNAGLESAENALRVGGWIEETDIVDLRAAIAQVPGTAAATVYGNLLSASYQHLRAFARALARMGVTYQPEILADADYAEILAGSNGRGRRGGR